MAISNLSPDLCLGFEGWARASKHRTVGSGTFIDHKSGISAAISAGLPSVFQDEWNALLQESDREFFHAGLWVFGKRLEQAGKLELAARLYREMGSREASLTAEAERRLAAVQARGSLGARGEILLGQILTQATDPKLIVPMLAGSAAFYGTRAAVGTRLANLRSMAWSRAIGANATAFAAELTTFVATARGLNAVLGDRPTSGFADDWLHAALNLGSLKLATHFGARWGGFASLGGIFAAQRLEISLGLRPNVDAVSSFAESLGLLGSLGVGAYLGRRIFGDISRHADLAYQGNLPRPSFNISNPFHFPLWQTASQLASTSVVPALRHPPNHAIQMMTMRNPGDSSSADKPKKSEMDRKTAIIRISPTELPENPVLAPRLERFRSEINLIRIFTPITAIPLLLFLGHVGAALIIAGLVFAPTVLALGIDQLFPVLGLDRRAEKRQLGDGSTTRLLPSGAEHPETNPGRIPAEKIVELRELHEEMLQPLLGRRNEDAVEEREWDTLRYAQLLGELPIDHPEYSEGLGALLRAFEHPPLPRYFMDHSRHFLAGELRQVTLEALAHVLSKAESTHEMESVRWAARKLLRLYDHPEIFRQLSYRTLRLIDDLPRALLDVNLSDIENGPAYQAFQIITKILGAEHPDVLRIEQRFLKMMVK